MLLNPALIDSAADIGISLKYAKTGDKSRIGIHLLNPSEERLLDALETAERDMFPAIYIHNMQTWGALRLVKG